MWRPTSEAEAATGLVAFLEWLRATSGDDTLTPELLRAWSRSSPAAFVSALACAHGVAPVPVEAVSVKALFAQWDAVRPPASAPDAG